MSDNCEKLKNLINTEKTGPIFFVTPNPNRAVGVENIIEGYHVICSHKSDIVGYMKRENVSVFCLNDDSLKSSSRILRSREVIDYIKERSKDKKANIMTFKPDPMVAALCARNNFGYIGVDWRLNRKLENKVEFVNITKNLRIPNAYSRTVRLERKCFEDILEALNNGEKSVIQLPRGFSGNSTFLIKDRGDLNNVMKVHKGKKVKLSKYIKGETYTVNACVGKSEILISKPMFQITGVSYNKNKFGTSGNDYILGCKIDVENRKRMFNYAKRVGEYIRKLKYRGIFGLDFVADKDNIHLIEINPRLVASIPVFTKLQIVNDQFPFLFLHIMQFLNESYTANCCEMTRFESWEKVKPFSASQLMLRNTTKNILKITSALQSGIYEIRRDELFLKEESYYMNRRLKRNELLVQCLAENNLVKPDADYANIQTSYGIMKNKKQFVLHFEKAAKLVLKNIKTELVL